MALANTGIKDSYTDGETLYTGPEIEMTTQALDSQLFGYLRAAIAENPNGCVVKVPDGTSWAVSNGGVVSPGAGIVKNVNSGAYGAVYMHTLGNVTINNATPGFEGSTTQYLFAVAEYDANDSRKTGEPLFVLSGSPTYNGGILLAEVTTSGSAISAATDMRTFPASLAFMDAITETTIANDDYILIYDSSVSDYRKMTRANFVAGISGGGSVPTGTGFVHVVDGVQDAAAKLVSNADIAADAAIAESKLDLATDAAAGTGSRRTLGTGATQAAPGNHSHSNVTPAVAGFMTPADKTKLNNATSSAIASRLAERDAGGRLQVATPVAGADAANKEYVDGVAIDGAPDADHETKGITYLTTEPVSDPLAVGDNDPRMSPIGTPGNEELPGLVPATGVDPVATEFLNRQGDWAVPPSGSLAVQEEGNPPVNTVDTIVFERHVVTDNEDGSVNVKPEITNLTELDDTPSDLSGQEGKILAVKSGEAEFELISQGPKTFIALNDTPSNLTGLGGKYLRVKPDESGIDTGDGGGGGGGGSDVLNDLEDVAIAAPANHHGLFYDHLNSLWVNRRPAVLDFLPDDFEDALLTAMASVITSSGDVVTSSAAGGSAMSLVFNSPAFEVLTDEATVLWDFDGKRISNATVTLTDDRTLDIDNLVSGCTGLLIIKQDGTGGHSLTLPAGSKVVNSGAGALELNTAASAINIASFIYDGTNLFWNYGVSYS